MADPYADRTSPLPAPERLASEAPLAAAARGAGVRVLTGVEDAAAGTGGLRADAAGGDGLKSNPCAIVLADEGLLPPLARISPEFAVALLCGLDPAAAVKRESGASAAGAGAALDALAVAGPLYLLKGGLVAGPAGREGALLADDGTTLAALAAAGRDEVGWERDPDFGYEVAVSVPELEGAAADAFVPRILYAAADRVYDHAELVELTKRRRHERLEAAGVRDPALHRAVGWPIEPTGQEWKD